MWSNINNLATDVTRGIVTNLCYDNTDGYTWTLPMYHMYFWSLWFVPVVSLTSPDIGIAPKLESPHELCINARVPRATTQAPSHNRCAWRCPGIINAPTHASKTGYRTPGTTLSYRWRLTRIVYHQNSAKITLCYCVTRLSDENLHRCRLVRFGRPSSTRTSFACDTSTSLAYSTFRRRHVRNL